MNGWFISRNTGESNFHSVGYGQVTNVVTVRVLFGKYCISVVLSIMHLDNQQQFKDKNRKKFDNWGS